MIIKNTWQGYWSRHHTHEYGMCFPDHQNKKFWVNIPKCATVWGKKWASANQLRPNNYHHEKYLEQDYQPIIFLRDPLERWYTGIVEYIFRQGVLAKNVSQLNEDFLSLLIERIAFDEHTEEQIMFLENIDIHQAVWFCVDNNLIKNFQHYCNNVLKQDVELVPKVKMHKAGPHHQKLKNLVQHSVENSEYRIGGSKIPVVDKIKDYYRLDYQLYNSVKYYTKGEK